MDDRTGLLMELEPNQSMPPGFHAIPDDLTEAARDELAGRKQAIVYPAGFGPMPQYLRNRRRMMQKRKARNRRLRKGK